MALLSGSAVASENAVLLTGKSLHDAVSGKTIYIQTPIAEIPIRYRPDGTMVGVSSAQLAALAGEAVKTDTGRWWVRRAELCQQWSKWSNGRAYCYKLRVTGKHVAWSRNDGDTGTARLGN
ncbi:MULTISPECIES: hypothetical protein [Rhodomicrobium]|uniref:hypothetical protein n=1 Tax=Rhodomicrobium TaxID=1068 RepID=UPI000B4B76F2|nr:MULTISPECIES: hypothetical protein [Rhodomicrobium]